jgi:Bax protein
MPYMVNLVAYLYFMKPPLHYWLLFLAGAYALTTLSGCDRTKTFSVKSETIKVNSLKQIVPLGDARVKPFLYTNVSGLDQLPVSAAKAKFIAAVLPAILVAKHEIETLKIKIDLLQETEYWNKADSSFYLAIKNRYKAANLDDLNLRIGTLPNSIVLAQAAVESGWGQSRFFLEGNNLFGVWSFNSNEPRIAAGRTRAGKRIYLRSYQNLSQSIIHYFEILGSVRAYRSLRHARLVTADPFELLPHLKNFSERRTSYTNQLKAIILQNELTQYDRYTLDPQYLVKD